MKYYIPTSSLNFNNIFSTESISPAAFYKLRGYGYSRWFSVSENNQDGAVLLYDEPHSFSRPKSDLEDHPMMLEIRTDEKFPRLKDGVFYSNHTIYFNVTNCRVIFFSEDAKRTVWSLSEGSLETKLADWYLKRALVRSFDGAFPSLDGAADVQVDESTLMHDLLVNKMRGFLFGYYIGANLSAQSEDVKRLNVLREIQNVFAAIAASPKRKASLSQTARLSELNAEFRDTDSFWLELVAAAKGVQNAENVLGVLQRHHVEVPLFDLCKLGESLHAGALADNKALTWIKWAIEKRKDLMSAKCKMLQVSDEEAVVADGKLVKVYGDNIGKGLDERLFTVWVNEVLVSKQFSGKISPSREVLSDALTVVAKKVTGEKWEGSDVRTFLNQLRYHVRGGAFEQTWDNGVLSSVAAVVLKGDDWEQLLRFMQSNGMTDYRLAFAVYGTLNGFANLPRDFADLLLGSDVDHVYWQEVYGEFWGQLHGTSLCFDEKGNAEGGALRDRVLSFFDSKNFTYRATKNCSKAKLRNGLLLALDSVGADGNVAGLLSCLNDKYADYGWGKSKKPFKQLQAKLIAPILPGLEPSGTTKKNALKSSTGSDRDSVADTKLNLLDDKSWIDVCAERIADAKSKARFLEDMEWFVGNHQVVYHDKRKGNVAGVYNGKGRANVQVLERLTSFLTKKATPKVGMEWVSEMYAKIPVRDILAYLKDSYV